MSKIRTTAFRLFDVTLRDGLQSSRNILPIDTKLGMLRKIADDFKPKSIEVGSLASPKVLPQLADSEKVFEHALSMINSNDGYTFTPYLLVPPKADKLDKALDIGCDSISIPSSTSEAFQQKNVKITQCDKREDNGGY